MGKEHRNTNFYLLDQKGLARIQPTVEFKRPNLGRKPTGTEKAITRAAQMEIKGLLNVEHMQDILNIPGNPTLYESTVQHANDIIAGTNDIKDPEVSNKILQYAKTADSVIASAVKDLPPEFADYGNKSIIRNITHPVDLALAIFDKNFNQRDRFRALRKLLLMRMAAVIDRKETDGQTDNAYQQVERFFQDNVNPILDESKDNSLKYLVSTHHKKDFSTIETDIIDEDKRMLLVPHQNQKITPIAQRTFTLTRNGTEQTINIYFPNGVPGKPRRKQAETMILKQLRDDRENPALSVDDQVGFMALFDQPDDVTLFLKHLSDHATRRGHMLAQEKVQDTLEDFSGLRWFKAMLHMDGMRPEFIAHTPTTYANYRFQDGLSHREYTNNRLFRDGVIELLFPPELYKYSLRKLQTYATNKVRRQIREEV